uniref:Uncharacterized protein n=1 Tax=Clytia hemisphaerica TaxID=252671 RepID=A0A7M5X9M1_9CNID
MMLSFFYCIIFNVLCNIINATHMVSLKYDRQSILGNNAQRINGARSPTECILRCQRCGQKSFYSNDGECFCTNKEIDLSKKTSKEDGTYFTKRKYTSQHSYSFEIPGAVPYGKGKVFKTIPVHGPNWEISFKTIRSEYYADFQTVLHFSALEDPMEWALGHRIPAFYLHTDKLKVRTPAGSNINRAMEAVAPENQQFHVNLTSLNNKIYLYIDGNLKQTDDEPTGHFFENVQVWITNPSYDGKPLWDVKYVSKITPKYP